MACTINYGSLYVSNSGLRHKHVRLATFGHRPRLLLVSLVGKMEPSVDNMPGVKEAAKTYLAAKQIPQLFQVAKKLIIT